MAPSVRYRNSLSRPAEPERPLSRMFLPVRGTRVPSASPPRKAARARLLLSASPPAVGRPFHAQAGAALREMGVESAFPERVGESGVGYFCFSLFLNFLDAQKAACNSFQPTAVTLQPKAFATLLGGNFVQ